MPFNLNKLRNLSGDFNTFTSPTNPYAFWNEDDTLAQMKASNYFLTAGSYFQVGTLIFVQGTAASDLDILKVTQITPTVETASLIEGVIDSTYIESIIDAAYIEGIINAAYVQGLITAAYIDTQIVADGLVGGTFVMLADFSELATPLNGISFALAPRDILITRLRTQIISPLTTDDATIIIQDAAGGGAVPVTPNPVVVLPFTGSAAYQTTSTVITANNAFASGAQIFARWTKTTASGSAMLYVDWLAN